jgi:uncharacterized protein (UPF0303 family)
VVLNLELFKKILWSNYLRGDTEENTDWLNRRSLLIAATAVIIISAI